MRKLIKVNNISFEIFQSTMPPYFLIRRKGCEYSFWIKHLFENVGTYLYNQEILTHRKEYELAINEFKKYMSLL